MAFPSSDDDTSPDADSGFESGGGYDYSPPPPAETDDSILSGVSDEKVKDFIGSNENTIPYMYLDTGGNVTVGTGVEVKNQDEATQMPFEMTQPDGTIRKATKQEIADAYDNVQDSPSGPHIPASFFNPQTNPDFDPLSLPQSYMEQQFEDHLSEHADQLDQSLANRGMDLDSLPENVKLGLLDMHYNMGAGNLFHKNQNNFWNAIENQDWNGAAILSHRGNVSDERNDATANLFRFESPDNF
jgi:GH24 family phage-related lysozyme (muramidase)